MDLSSKMPATQPAKMEAKMEATMKSEAPMTGGGGTEMAPQQGMSQKSSGGVPYEATGSGSMTDWEFKGRQNGMGWETADRKGS